MKKITLTFLLICSACAVMAQSGKLNYAVSIARFQQLYNEQKADSIFQTFAPALRSALPLDKTRSTISSLYGQVGKLKKTEIWQEEPENISYKAEFENAILVVTYSLNEKNEVQGLFLKPYTAPVPEETLPGVEYTVVTENGSPVSGTLVMPTNQDKMPVVVIIAGSGPTDRDCNSTQGIHSNAYRMLADSLAQHGIASLRYDKRGVAKSRKAMQSEADLRLENMVNDAVAYIKKLRGSGSFTRIYLLGHSEGSLIAMLAAQKVPVEGVLSVAGAGVPADEILLSQVKEGYPDLYEKSVPVLQQLKEGKQVPVEDMALQRLFRATVQPYMISWIKYDPRVEIRKLKVPVMIIQGNTDLQVRVADANNLKTAKPDASLLIIDQMNHVLKTATADPAQNAATYQDPKLSLHQDLVKAVVGFTGT